MNFQTVILIVSHSISRFVGNFSFISKAMNEKDKNNIYQNVILSLLCPYASVNSTCAQLPPRATAGHLPALSVPGVGHLQILHCPGAGHLPTPGHSRAFDTHAFSCQNITTKKVLLEKQIGSSVKDRNKL